MSNYLLITLKDGSLIYRSADIPDHIECHQEQTLKPEPISTGSELPEYAEIETTTYKKILVQLVDYNGVVALFVDELLLDAGVSIRDIALNILEFEQKKRR